MTAKLHLDTPRLTCSQIAEDDWDFFRQLQLSPHVMHHVADAKSEEKILADFTARLPLWSPRSAHWLCLVVREKQSGNRMGVSDYIHRENDCAEVGFLFAPLEKAGFVTEMPAVNPAGFSFICSYALLSGTVHCAFIENQHADNSRDKIYADLFASNSVIKTSRIAIAKHAPTTATALQPP